MATTISTQDIVNAKRDIDDIGKAVNEKVIVSPRYGEDFKSIPLIVQEGNQEIINLQNAIEIAAAAGAGENGWTAQLIVDASGKTQQDINTISKVNYLENFNGGELSADNTGAVLAAANSGNPVILKSGKTYKLKTNGINLGLSNLVIVGDGTSTLLLEKGSTDRVFNLQNHNQIKIQGVNVEAYYNTNWNEGLRFFNLNTEPNIDHLESTNCKFKGNVRIFNGFGSTERLPLSNPYGIKKFVFSGNGITGIQSSLVTLSNYPIYDGEIYDNYAKDFNGSLISIGLTNASVNGDEIHEITSIKAHGNKAAASLGHWSVTSGSSSGSNYYCFMLVEGAYAEWVDNTITGLKANQAGVTVCDAYLSCNIVISSGNTWANNGNFTTGETTNCLIHAKKDKTTTKKPHKQFFNNTYTIDKQWLADIGKTSIYHRLYNIGVTNGGDCLFTDNSVDLDGLTSSYNNICEDFTFSRNQIQCNTLVDIPTGQAIWINNVKPADGLTPNLNVSGNSVTVRDAGTKSIILMLSRREGLWGSFIVDKNTVNVMKYSGVSSAVLCASAYAIDGRVTDNTVVGGCFYDHYALQFEKATRCGNNFIGSRETSGQWLGFLNQFKEGVLNQSGVGSVQNLRIPLYTDKTKFSVDKTIGYNVKFEFERFEGKTSIEFKYELVYTSTDDLLRVRFTDETSFARSHVVLSIGGNNINTEIEKIGGDDLTIGVRLRNSIDDAYFEVYGIPTGKIKYDLDVLSF